MIINFSVQNFHAIKDKVTLSFEATNSKDLEEYYVIEAKKGLRLLKLGLLFGANASGKTSVLKALDFLRYIVLNPFGTKTDTFPFEPFLFDAKTPNQNTFFVLEFIQNEIKYLYELELNKEAIRNEKLFFYKPNKALVFERTTDTKKQLTDIKFGGKIKDVKKKNKIGLENNTLWNNTVLGGYLKTNFESHELQEVKDWFGTKLVGLIQPKTDIATQISQGLIDKQLNKENLLTFLKKADFNIINISIDKKEIEVSKAFIDTVANTIEKKLLKDNLLLGRETVKVEKMITTFQHKVENSQYALPYSEESEGTKRYYQFAGLLDLMIRHERIFSIDELESSLHPDLLKHFLLIFLVNVKNSQLIATSHYRELLMDKDIFRNDAIWFTEKQENGGTDLFSLADFDSSVVRDTSSIFNAYKTGKLGAVPSLGDYYIDLENGKT